MIPGQFRRDALSERNPKGRRAHRGMGWRRCTLSEPRGTRSNRRSVRRARSMRSCSLSEPRGAVLRQARGDSRGQVLGVRAGNELSILGLVYISISCRCRELTLALMYACSI